LTYDLARALRDRGVTVIGGFHTPMEKECLALLLRGSQPVVVCPARSIERMRPPADWRRPLFEGQLLLLSPFAAKDRRATAEMAILRNRFVAALADAIVVAYAAPDSKTERFARDLIADGHAVYTLDDIANARLIAVGARPLTPADIGRELGG
jgi:predicted Rossmann fold nucleotide-binding protein DprA/Smf involved in DNA uptake